MKSIGIPIVPINFDRHNNYMKGIDDDNRRYSRPHD